MTPSMVTLPKYAGSRSWGSIDSQESTDTKEKEPVARADERKETDRDQARLGEGANEVQWSEKELPPIPEESERGSTYYEDASDEEEAREIGVTRQVGIARSSRRRVEFSRKMS
ncbi:hypothetical protein E8E11_004602 [Didymella keratinophila]|nr:hypothetical protein E8E11_004602 [Didymella keratinophila]